MYYAGARERFDEIAARLPDSAWQQLSCGAGTKGERLYDWAFVFWRNADQAEDEQRGFLVRRNPTDPTDEAYFIVFAQAGTTLPTLAQVAGQRWVVRAGMGDKSWCVRKGFVNGAAGSGGVILGEAGRERSTTSLPSVAIFAVRQAALASAGKC